jgi:hypothetical protein
LYIYRIYIYIIILYIRYTKYIYTLYIYYISIDIIIYYPLENDFLDVTMLDLNDWLGDVDHALL